MTENKFWSFVGIALAVTAFFYEKVSILKLLLIGIIIVIICFVVSYVWNKLLNSNYKRIDKVFYLFNKAKLPYVVVDKMVHYNVKSKKEATYELKCKLKIKKVINEFCYKGRYHWDQEDEIIVSVMDKDNYQCTTTEDLKWSNVDIVPVGKIIHRNELIDCGFTLENLHISRINKHSYLSCKVIEKVKHLRLTAEVNPNLKPLKEAAFITQNALGEELSRETVKYNETSHSYVKNVEYPRRGRKYIIKWDYEK